MKIKGWQVFGRGLKAIISIITSYLTQFLQVKFPEVLYKFLSFILLNSWFLMVQLTWKLILNTVTSCCLLSSKVNIANTAQKKPSE